MSDRVIVIKILGLGDAGSRFPAIFTSRFHPEYATALHGTVVSLTDQLSSEIPVFGTMGSDSTTSFTVLSTADTRRILMSRGKTAVTDATGQPVRVAGYISPKPGTVTIPVVDPSLFTEGNYYRIQNTVFEITSNSPTLEGGRIWGCADVPIPMMSQGTSNALLGSVIYDLNNGNPLGGCEQLPVIIETIDLESTTPEVIFRGYISKVSNDTSSGQTNLIKVDCSSMMAYLKQAPFTPAWGSVSARTSRLTGRIYQTGGTAEVVQAVTETRYDRNLYGTLFDPLSPVDGDTRVTLWQIRQEGKGGISVPTLSTTTVTLDNDVYLDFDDGATARNNSYQMSFNNGHYGLGSFGPQVEIAFDIHGVHEGGVNRENWRNWSSSVTQQQTTVRGENCLTSASFTSAIIDLLLGTYAGDLTLQYGARSATEAAWLPFPSAGIGTLIDLPSLYALTQGLQPPDVVSTINAFNIDAFTPTSVIIPYEHTSVKTVGDVLEGILKRLGAYMVYDKGKFYFGSWAGKRQTPTFISDTALSDPSIKLSFDRGMCLMRVNATFCTDLLADKIVYDVPFVNPELASSGLGKEMSIGHWQTNYSNPDTPAWGSTRLMANAFGLLMRYSQSAARVDVSLRDSVVDLEVGQEIALTSSYLVNSEGGLGIQALTGYVLKAARSWQTPTTAYTIILPGYLSVSNQLPVWSCSGKVADVPGGDDIEIEPNEFTLVNGFASIGAPDSDAQAFENTFILNGAACPVQLLDQYGTLKYQSTLTAVDVGANLLTIPGFDAYAVPGDIIVLDTAYGFNLDAIYDVFLADTVGQVAGSTDYARKWVP